MNRESTERAARTEPVRFGRAFLDWSRLALRENAFPIALFAGLRVWTMVWAAVGALLVTPSSQVMEQYYGVEPLNDAIVAPWQRWDTIWYAKIAMDGYGRDQSVHFPPLYPFLIRASSPLTGGNTVAAGLLLSSIAALAAFVLLYRLVCSMYDKGTAERALLYLAVFPTAFFLFAAYTEPLFLMFVLGAFLCARSGRWGGAGLCGACAAMTRGQGTLFILPLAVEFWMQYRRGEVSLTRAWTLLPVLAGGAVHVLWVTYQFGSPGVYLSGEQLMHRFALPVETLAVGWGAVLGARSPAEAFLALLDPVGLLILAAGVIWSARKLPLSMTVYAACVAIPSLFILTNYSEQYPLTSVSRFVILAFPLFLLFGTVPRRWWQAPVLAVSLVFQTVLLTLFAAWVFVR
jgi:hypothetical protein